MDEHNDLAPDQLTAEHAENDRAEDEHTEHEHAENTGTEYAGGDESAESAASAADAPDADLVLSLAPQRAELGDEGFGIARTSGGVTTVEAAKPAGLLYGFFHVVRLGEAAFADEVPSGGVHKPALSRRMADHWDNVDVEPTMGQVERGYAGGSIFWEAGRLREDLSRVRSYARLLAACGINAVSVNNVNVHRTEAHLLTDRLGESAHLAVPHGRDVLYVIEERAPGRPPLVTEVGVRMPAHLTASGRAILSLKAASEHAR